MGDYILTEDDCLENRTFEDEVAYGGWCIDLHCPHGLLDTHILPSGTCYFFDGVYSIPYRSYYSRNIRNLFMAGRNISATKLGMCSTRIIGCCAIGGQAVGAAAALCTKYGCMPRELMPHIKELQQIILKNDGFLPAVKGNDPADLAKLATFSSSSCKADCEPAKVIDGISRKLGDDMHGWVSDGLSENGETLTMAWETPQEISELRYTFHSDFSYPIRVTMAPNRQKQQRDGVPAELVKDYDIVLKKGGAVVHTIPVVGNHQRHNIHRFEKVCCDTVELHVHSTNGADTVTVFEVRAY